MLFEVYKCVQLNRWLVVCGCVLHMGQRGEVWCVLSTLCRYNIMMTFIGSKLGEGATFFSGEGEFGRGVLMYEFVMVVL